MSNRFTGRKTGLEPVFLQNVEIPASTLIHGCPGAKILDSDRYKGLTANLGAQGETLFLKALVKTGVLDKFVSFWSVNIPKKTSWLPDGRLKADIDCVLLTEGIIHLIDVKFFKSGFVDYVSKGDKLFCISALSGRVIGKPLPMGTSMRTSDSRIKILGMPYLVKSHVVFMPTSNGVPKSVSAIWPGNIPALTVDFFIDSVRNYPSVNVDKIDERIIKGFDNLLYKNGG